MGPSRPATTIRAWWIGKSNVLIIPPLLILPNARARWGEAFAFYPAVSSIIQACASRAIPLAVASRTHDPDLARDMLKALHIIPSFSDNPAANTKTSRALEYFDFIQIFPGNKTQHFLRIHQVSGVEYEDMLFFDDEARNRNVETELGVTFCLVRDGMKLDVVDRGVWAWRKRNGIKKNADGELPN